MVVVLVLGLLFVVWCAVCLASSVVGRLFKETPDPTGLPLVQA